MKKSILKGKIKRPFTQSELNADIIYTPANSWPIQERIIKDNTKWSSLNRMNHNEKSNQKSILQTRFNPFHGIFIWHVCSKLYRDTPQSQSTSRWLKTVYIKWLSLTRQCFCLNWFVHSGLNNLGLDLTTWTVCGCYTINENQMFMYIGSVCNCSHFKNLTTEVWKLIRTS